MGILDPRSGTPYSEYLHGEVAAIVTVPDGAPYDLSDTESQVEAFAEGRTRGPPGTRLRVRRTADAIDARLLPNRVRDAEGNTFSFETTQDEQSDPSRTNPHVASATTFSRWWRRGALACTAQPLGLDSASRSALSSSTRSNEAKTRWTAAYRREPRCALYTSRRRGSIYARSPLVLLRRVCPTSRTRPNPTHCRSPLMRVGVLPHEAGCAVVIRLFDSLCFDSCSPRFASVETFSSHCPYDT